MRHPKLWVARLRLVNRRSRRCGHSARIERYSRQHVKVKEREDGGEHEQPDHGRSHAAAVGVRERFFESVGVNHEIGSMGSIEKRRENFSNELSLGSAADVLWRGPVDELFG
jgi:hypothetical protein